MIDTDSSIRLNASPGRRPACRLALPSCATAFLCLAASGCVTHRAELTSQVLPLTAEARARMGTIGIVAGSAPNISIAKPRSRWGSTAVGAGGGALAGLQVPGGSADPWALFIQLGVSAVGLPVGAVVGYFQGMSAEEVKEGEQQLRRANEQVHVEDLICRQLLQVLRTTTPHPAMLITTTNATAMAGADLADALADRGMDTVLEVTVREIGLLGERTRSAPLRVCIVVDVRLVRAADEVEYFEQTFTRQSSPLTFSGWSAEGARSFRREANESATRLAQEIVHALFSGPVPRDARSSAARLTPP